MFMGQIPVLTNSYRNIFARVHDFSAADQPGAERRSFNAAPGWAYHDIM
jgi:hypothetical protein